MSRNQPHSGFRIDARPGPQPSPLTRSFRFHYIETEGGIGHILDRHAARGKPLDLNWLTEARQYQDSITIRNLEVDSRQDLLLLVQYDQPHSHNPKGITVYPVQLSHPVIANPHGMSVAHRRAREAAISMHWGEGDCPDPDDVTVEIFICGDRFALFVRYSSNQRVVIYNWKTGEQVARIDSKRKHTDADSTHLVAHPLDVATFAWLAPDAFMIGAVVQHRSERLQDGLYIYELSDDAQNPLVRSVMLEMPRWKPAFCTIAGGKIMQFVSGSWSEDIYPGGLSDNMYDRVTVVREDREESCDVFYVLRNDYLVKCLLSWCNGQILGWEQWSQGQSPCVRAFDCIDWKNPENLSLQICGWKVMAVYGNPESDTTQVNVYDFNPATLDPVLAPGSVKTDACTIATGPNTVFEKGSVESNLPYRYIPLQFHIPWGTKFELGTDCIFCTRKDDHWRTIGRIPVRAHYPQVLARPAGA